MPAPRGRQITNFGGFLNPFGIGSSSLVEAIYPDPASANTGVGDPDVYIPLQIAPEPAVATTLALLGQVTVWVDPDTVRAIMYVRVSLQNTQTTRTSKEEEQTIRTELTNDAIVRTFQSGTMTTRQSHSKELYTRTVQDQDKEL